MRLSLARAGWQVNHASNQELGAKPPEGWPVVGEILERSKNASKTSIRTITGSNGVVRYLELIARGETDKHKSSTKRKSSNISASASPSQRPADPPPPAFAAPVWKFAKLAQEQLGH